jgi:Holliday junction DNA helicase RuvA
MAVYEYIQGNLIDITPAAAVIDKGGIGYFIQISLNTYSQIRKKQEVKLYIQEIIREDSHDLFGFNEPAERDLFRMLITVNGVGANTARMMLSSIPPGDMQKAILTEDVNLIKSVKGIGAKTAQRIIIDLKDKIGKVGESSQILTGVDNTIREEALSALVMLGFGKNETIKVLDKLLTSEPDLGVEELVKTALKKL